MSADLTRNVTDKKYMYVVAQRSVKAGGGVSISAPFRRRRARIPMSMGRLICVGVVVVCVAHMIDSVYGNDI